MEFHDKLNKFTKQLNDYFYFVNNTLKSNPVDGMHLTDFEPLTFEDIIFNVPNDSYMSSVILGTGQDNEFRLQLIHNEYSLLRSDIQLEMEISNKFASALRDLKLRLTGDGLNVSYSKDGECRIYRDNFSQNGKVRTIYVEEFIVTL